MNAHEVPSEVAGHVLVALEASCDALITLESLPGRGADDEHGVERRIAQASDALRQAIAQLRSVIAGEQNALALGFVVQPAAAERDQGGHARPRRTA
jgi:hypothetical protein